MKIPKLDERDKKDIVRSIEAAAQAYTPEWRFDLENMDVGAALAMIYTDMFSGTIERFNRVSAKNRIAFFNEMNARLLPAIPSSGYVTFGLAGAIDQGVAVPAKTQLIGDTKDPDIDSTVFETVNDVYVTPAVMSDIFCVSGANDFLSCLYENLIETEWQPIGEPHKLFDLNGQNRQEHVFYCGHPGALNIKNAGWIEVAFYSHYENKVPKEILEKLLDEEYASWEYASDNGFIAFEGAKIQNEKLLFFKGEKQPPFALAHCFSEESRWIRCTVKNIEPFKDFFIDKVSLTSMGAGILPDVIHCAGMDQNIHECFPFGEKMSVFSDVYFASDEALTKTGSTVTLSFNLNFISIPVDLELTDPNVNWKMVMRRTDFRPDVEYDITIASIMWEYYNGMGWARLFEDDQYNQVFSTEQGTMGQFRTITFQNPEDMQKILVNSCESCYIRARIMKINNAYKTKGNYIAPLIDGINFAYEYKEKAVLPTQLYLRNGMEEQSYSEGMLKDPSVFFRPFCKLAEEEMELYIGFSIAPKEGPIKLLFALGDTIKEKLPRLSWEYYGRGGWHALNLVDETENMRKTGIVTLMGNSDFTKCRFFAKERYWIRIKDTFGRYNNPKIPVQLPLLTNLYINVTQIQNTQTREVEVFSPDPHTEHFLCNLQNKQVQEITVEVKEEDAWTTWSEVSDFSFSHSEDRHYMVNRNQGLVAFSDGKNGKIPPGERVNSIRIHYSTGGGRIGNLEVGMVNRTNLTIGFVSTIDNPQVTSGGCDIETVGESIERSAAALKHGNRGVTARDYEALAMEATRNIKKAKCFAGYNEQGLKEFGSVTLVVLQKDFETGRSFFPAIKEQVKNYMSRRISGNIADLNRFYVIEPNFLELCIRADISVADFNSVFQAKEEVEQRLLTFIDPVAGNFDGLGWEIGSIPNSTQILNCLKDVPSVAFVKNVFVSAYMDGKHGRSEADLEHLKNRIFALPISGKHEIRITVEEKR